MMAIFWRILKDKRIQILIYCLASIGLLWMYIALFPAFKDQSASLEQLIKSYPESFMKAFNFDIKSFTTVEGYLATEQYSFVYPLMVIFMLVGFAGSAFAGEIERGTIEVLISQPISRWKLFISRYLAGLLILMVFTATSVYSAIPLSRAYDISVSAEAFNKLAILAFMFALAIYSIAIMLSAIFSDRGKVFFIAGGLLIAMYVLNIISALRDSLSDLKFASFFYYFNPAKALGHNEIDKWAYLVFLGVAFICTLIGAIWFAKRDIAV